MTDTTEQIIMAVLVVFCAGALIGFVGSNELLGSYYREYSLDSVLKCVEDGGQYQADGEALYPSARCNYGPKSVAL
jgi:hypothetical protein